MPGKWLKRTGFKRKKLTRFLDFKNKKRFVGRKFRPSKFRSRRAYRAKSSFKTKVLSAHEALFNRGVQPNWGTPLTTAQVRAYDSAQCTPVLTLHLALANWFQFGVPAANDSGDYIFVKYIVIRIMVSNTLMDNRTTTGHMYCHKIMARNKNYPLNAIPLNAFIGAFSQQFINGQNPVNIDVLAPNLKNYASCKRYVSKWKAKKFTMGMAPALGAIQNTLASNLRVFVWKIPVKRMINITTVGMVTSSFRDRAFYVSATPNAVAGTASHAMVCSDYDIVYSEGT